jgi:hypothetical protein
LLRGQRAPCCPSPVKTPTAEIVALGRGVTAVAEAAPPEESTTSGVSGALELGGAWRTGIFGRSDNRSEMCARPTMARGDSRPRYSWTSYGERLNGGRGCC